MEYLKEINPQTGTGAYASVNGIKMYYEVHGRADGVPLVLLHGGGSTIDVTWSRILPALARSRRVIAVEEQGQALEVVVLEAFTRVSVHDHVGSMVFDAARCLCSSCGQAWVFGLDDRGDPWWVPQWYDGDDGQVVTLGRRNHHRPKV